MTNILASRRLLYSHAIAIQARLDELLDTKVTEATYNTLHSKTLQQAKDWSQRASKFFFLGSTLKRQITRINKLLEVDQVAHRLDLPFFHLAQRPDQVRFIKANHLHHKLTEAHKKSGVRIKYVREDLKFPCAIFDPTTRTATRVSKEMSAMKYDPRTMKLKGCEVLVDGIEEYDPKNWEYLRPIQKAIGEPDSITHINVHPWGWNPAGGSLFGHSYLSLVVNEEEYVIGYNLSGRLLNPDFMAYLPKDGKDVGSVSFKFNERKGQDLLRLIEAAKTLQHHNGEKPENVSDDEWEMIINKYHHLLYRVGGTCSDFSTSFWEFATGKELPNKPEKTFSKSLFAKILDFLYNFLPNALYNIIRKVMILTRSIKPVEIKKQTALP